MAAFTRRHARIRPPASRGGSGSGFWIALLYRAWGGDARVPLFRLVVAARNSIGIVPFDPQWLGVLRSLE